MSTLFVFLLLGSIVGLVAGLIKPTLFNHFKFGSRKFISIIFGGLILVSFIGIGVTAPPSQDSNEIKKAETPVSPESAPVQTNQQGASQVQDGLFLVTRVIDGDTIEIEGGNKVRYIGIDSPELVDPRKPVQFFGIEASNKNKELVLNKKVRLEKDVTETDKYGRLLRYVYIGNTFINLELVRQGYAYSYSYPPDIKYQDQFVEAQRQAKEQNKGLWGSCPVTTQTGAPATTSSPIPQQTQQSSSCDIKGNISSGGHIYHLPGCGSYNQTVINESQGEKWFCSEEEAVAAGWRKAKNCP